MVFLIDTLCERGHPAGPIMRDAWAHGNIGDRYYPIPGWFYGMPGVNDPIPTMETTDNTVIIVTPTHCWHFRRGT